MLTTVYIPAHINLKLFQERLRQKSIILYEGKGCFKNKVFQVGNIGELSFSDISFFLKSLEVVLDSFDPVDTTKVFLIKNYSHSMAYQNQSSNAESIVMEDIA